MFNSIPYYFQRMRDMDKNIRITSRLEDTVGTTKIILKCKLNCKFFGQMFIHTK